MKVPETFFSVNEELVLFGLSCLCGAAFGIFYDIFRTLRAMFRHSFVLVFIEDVVFFIGCGIALTAFSLTAAHGEMRFYYFIGSAVGFALYIFTVGNIVILTVRKLFGIIRRIFVIISAPFRTAFAFLCRKVLGKFVRSTEILKILKKIVKMLLLNPLRLLYNKIENKKRKNVKCVVGKTKRQ